MVTMHPPCMAIQPAMHEYAAIHPAMQPLEQPRNDDLGKPLCRKGFRVFPAETQDTPTQAMDLYSEPCIVMHRPCMDMPRYEWIPR